MISVAMVVDNEREHVDEEGRMVVEREGVVVAEGVKWSRKGAW